MTETQTKHVDTNEKVFLELRDERAAIASGGIRAWRLETKLTAQGAGWVDNIVNRLPLQQQRRVEEKRIRSMKRLDLAAVLRVPD